MRSLTVPVLLHIGTHKTGSTSIQSFCVRNRDSFLQEGVLYPQSFLKWYGHHELPWSCGKAHPHRDPSLDTDQIIHLLEQEVSETSAQRVILSSEEFEFLQKDAISTLLSFFDRTKVRVLVYLRRQDKLLESEYGHHVLMEETRFSGTIYDFYMSQNFIKRYDYAGLLARWESVLESSAITVRPFAMQQLDPAGLLKDFCQSADLTWSDEYTLPARGETNEGLSMEAVKILTELNCLDIAKSERNEILKVLRRAQAARDVTESGTSYLSDQNRRDLLRLFQESNREVAIRYLGKDDGKLFN